jgi:hypothetical protein
MKTIKKTANSVVTFGAGFKMGLGLGVALYLMWILSALTVTLIESLI